MNYIGLCINRLNGVFLYSDEIHLHGMGYILILTCYEVKIVSSNMLMVDLLYLYLFPTIEMVNPCSSVVSIRYYLYEND